MPVSPGCGVTIGLLLRACTRRPRRAAANSTDSRESFLERAMPLRNRKAKQTSNNNVQGSVAPTSHRLTYVTAVRWVAQSRVRGRKTPFYSCKNGGAGERARATLVF